MAPESVLTDLRLRAAADGTLEGASKLPLRERLKFERDLLVVWAREAGVAFPAEEYLSRVVDTHGEHHVFYNAEDPRRRDRFFKITHGAVLDQAGFALTVDTDFHIGKVSQRYIGVPYLREATPFEYLARLRLFNLTFRDFIEFEGVIGDPGKEAIITSQEFINGQAAASDEVEAFMTERGFVAVPGVVAGRGNSMSYFRRHDDVAVFDTHGQNFLISGMRMVPIDALIIYADEDLSAFLSMPEEERLAEVGIWRSRI